MITQGTVPRGHSGRITVPTERDSTHQRGQGMLSRHISRVRMGVGRVFRSLATAAPVGHLSCSSRKGEFEIKEVKPTVLPDGLHMGRCQPGEGPTLS